MGRKIWMGRVEFVVAMTGRMLVLTGALSETCVGELSGRWAMRVEFENPNPALPASPFTTYGALATFVRADAPVRLFDTVRLYQGPQYVGTLRITGAISSGAGR